MQAPSAASPLPQPVAASRNADRAAAVLAVAGSGLIVARHVWPDPLDELLSLHHLPFDAQIQLDSVLLAPLASVFVVFCRITLGLRMLGPFRPILIAVALLQTGVVAGSVFMAAILVLVALLRPRLVRRAWLPYFGRLSVLLATVVLAEVSVLLLGTAMESDDVIGVAFFPIVVLCLTADGFAREIERSGLHEAVWRAVVTVVIATVVALVAEIPAVSYALFEYPELLFAEIAAILLISNRMRWGLLERWNPPDGMAAA